MILRFFLYNRAFIESMDFQKKIIDSASMANYIEIYTDYRKISIIKVFALINKTKYKSYYIELLDFVIDTNIELNKEWTKNGKYFENKTKFFETFISDNYKEILKEKKKSKK